MCDFRKYPNCPKEVPNSLLNEENAQRIHSQSLKRLNERGGMCPLEIIANIERKSYRQIFDGHNTTDMQYYINKMIDYLKPTS